MFKNLIFLPLAVGLMVSSCTSYKKDGIAGGFTETQLGENIWRVNARGNAFATDELIADMILLRSADLATQNGFTHFAFTSGSKGSDTTTVYNPGTSYTTGTINTSPYSNTATYSGQTMTMGGFFDTYSKPKAENTVMMFKEKPKNARGVVYEAKFICQSLGKKLKAQCGAIK